MYVGYSEEHEALRRSCATTTRELLTPEVEAQLSTR